MASVDRPLCKWLIAVLGPEPRPPESLWQDLAQAFGPIEYRGTSRLFETTDYYREEFGTPLYRCLAAFRGLFGPETLPERKLDAARLEAHWSREGKRRFNLDIGYMDPDKVVLASFKSGPTKLYLGHGVYADLLLKYSGGRFEPMPWAFPDFQDGRYEKSLRVIRDKLKAELRKTREELQKEIDAEK